MSTPRLWSSSIMSWHQAALLTTGTAWNSTEIRKPWVLNARWLRQKLGVHELEILPWWFKSWKWDETNWTWTHGNRKCTPHLYKAEPPRLLHVWLISWMIYPISGCLVCPSYLLEPKHHLVSCNAPFPLGTQGPRHPAHASSVPRALINLDQVGPFENT